MRFRNTIIMLVLLAVVGGYAWIIANKSVPEETPKLFPKLKPDEITQVDLKYPDSEIVVDRTADGKWELSKPFKTDADQTACNNLARAIADVELKKTVEEKPAELAPFGLDKPEVVVTIAVKGKGKQPAIEVGKTTPVGFSAYFKTSDKPAV